MYFCVNSYYTYDMMIPRRGVCVVSPWYKAATRRKDLCQDVLWSFAALRCLPVDVLIGHLDITRLAVDATSFSVSFSYSLVLQTVDLLLGIDLEPDAQLFALILDIFIHTGGTEAIFHTLVLRPFFLGVRIPILDL